MTLPEAIYVPSKLINRALMGRMLAVYTGVLQLLATFLYSSQHQTSMAHVSHSSLDVTFIDYASSNYWSRITPGSMAPYHL